MRDHAATCDVYKTLVDVRFKLLTFLPTVTGIAVGIVAMDKESVSTNQWLLVGAIGLVTSLALIVYEVRNSLLHDCAIHRIQHLERVLGFRPSSASTSPKGVFAERSKSPPLFGGFMVKHDRALAMIYGVVIGAWAWVLIVGIERRWDVPLIDGGVATLVKVGGSVGSALLVAEEIARLGGRNRPPPLLYTISSSARGLDATAKAGRIATALRTAWVMLPSNWSLTQEAWLTELRRAPCVAALVHDERCPRDGKACPDCRGSAADVVKWMQALGQVEYQQSWRFWFWCRPSRRDDLRDRRLYVRRMVRGGPVPAWRTALRSGIVGADETARSQEAHGSFDALRTSLERRDGIGAPWTSLEELELRAALLERMSNMTG